LPTYEYNCPACKATYELRQSFSAETTHACEECGKGTAKRVLHAPRVVFKGSGWYVKDSRGKNPAGAGESKADDSPSTSESPTESPAPAATPTTGSAEASAAS
jgi:putative FmdB family regulatory protein